MQDREADQLLGWVAANEPGSVEQLLEATADQAHRHTGGDLKEARRVYQTMFEHLDEVGPSTQFWAWFDQILGGQKPWPEDEPSDKWLAQLKKGLKTNPQVERKPLQRRLVQMSFNGWFPCFAASLPLALAYLRNGMVTSSQLALALLFAVVNATLFGLAVGPWLSRWRRDLRTTMAKLRAVVLAATATLWSLLVLAGVQLSWRFGLAPSALHWAESLDEVFLRIDYRLVAASWVLGLLGCSLAVVLTHNRRWALYHGDSTGRRLLGLVLMLPVLWGLGLALWIASLDGAYDPGLLEGNPAPQAGLDDLPAAYTQNPDITRMDEAGGVADVEQANRRGSLWLKAVDEEWTGERPWRKLSIQALALDSADFTLTGDDGPVVTPIAIEVELVRQTITPGRY
ncbi:MAG: hypothetical protein KC910_15270, partial [Candidatus Eremiobacteraeota bacterium]|nr:hypothetical protein [Candidatus Eremiobacteraeota bacterium]